MTILNILRISALIYVVWVAGVAWSSYTHKCPRCIESIEVKIGTYPAFPVNLYSQKAREGLTWVVKRPSKVIKIKVLED